MFGVVAAANIFNKYYCINVMQWHEHWGFSSESRWIIINLANVFIQNNKAVNKILISDLIMEQICNHWLTYW